MEWRYQLAVSGSLTELIVPSDAQPSALIRAAAAEPKTCSFSLHKVKGFADDPLESTPTIRQWNNLPRGGGSS